VAAPEAAATSGPNSTQETDVTPAEPSGGPTPAHHARTAWEQRFEQANATHDGHLTLEQAKTGYKTVARHFHDIDTGGKGYVTEDDIRAWHELERAGRHPGQTAADDSLRPRPAVHRVLPGLRQFNLPSQPTTAPQTNATSPPITTPDGQAAANTGH
jgi:hypothetical protein